MGEGFRQDMRQALVRGVRSPGLRARAMPRSLLGLAVVSCFLAGNAHGNPSGATVASGSASISASGNTLTVTNTPGAIINWQQFSIQKDEITRFIQQSASSAVLNRVTGQDPSVILGQLFSNGRVFLINPSGIAFGPGAQINVGGLVASTLNISDADFQAGRLRFAGTGLEGKLTNAGTISTAAGGQVYLIAPQVENQASGVITSPKGEVVIAAGRTVELVNSQTPDLRVEFTAPENEAVNAGQIVAASGSIGIYGTLIRNSGLVSATRAEVGEGGKIVFRAVKDLMLEDASRIEAVGERGGTIELLGNQVGLVGQTSVDASGDSGGGTVLVGGDRHGDNPQVQNAWRTYVGSGASIRADALRNGNGGKVIVWADDVTRYYGSISARGGAQGGDGGFAEVSGKETLLYRGSADLGAPAGSLGTLLLDPRDITIQAAGANNAELGAGQPAGELAGQVLFGPATTTDFTISAGSIGAMTSANLVFQAQRDINVNAAVTLQNDINFVAQAGRDINVNAALTTHGVTAGRGNIHLEADSPHSGAAFDGVGLVNVGASVNACGGAAGGCAGGNVTLIGGGNSSPTGGFNLNANVQAGNGGINVALSNGGSLDFFIGAGGNTQLSSNDTGFLLSSGPLVLGTALSAGSDGYGTGATTLLVNSLSQLNANPMTLSPSSGTTFELVAGAGGITLDRDLTTFQTTIISTTGTFTLNSALNTSNNNLVISAASVNVAGGSITTGTGTLGCSGTGCPSGAALVDQWKVDAGGDWMLGSNWSLGAPPTAAQVALLDRPLRNAYAITLGSAAQTSPLTADVGLLVNYQDLRLTGNAANPTTLNIGSSITYNGSTASFNHGSMTLTHAALGGTGALDNLGSLALTDSSVSALLRQGIGGSLTASGANGLTGGFSMTAGTFAVLSGVTSVSGDSAYAGSVTVNAGSTLSLTGGSQTVYADGTTLSTGSLAGASGSTLEVAGADLGLDSGTAATLDVLNLSAGSVRGSGSLTVSGDFNQTGSGTLTGTFTDLSLTRSLGSFSVPTLAASGDITLTTLGSGHDLTINGAIGAGNRAMLSSAGAITLNSSVAAGGGGDALVAVAGTRFTNAAGASALSTPTAGARWLVYSLDPASAGESRGGLAYGFKQYNASFGTTPVLGSGNGFLYGVAPTITAALTGGVTKVYDGTATASLGSANYTSSGAIDGDVIALNNPATGSYDTKNAGAGKNVSATGLAIASATDGAAAVYGYQLASTGANANIGAITPAPLTITAQTNTKTYDGTTSAAALPTVSGLQTGDTVTGLTEAYADKNAGTGKTLGVTGYTVNDGNLGGNYVVSTVSDATGVINPALLTYVAASTSRETNTPNPVLSGSVTGFAAGETVSTATTGTLSFTTTATLSSPAGQYPIDGGGLTATSGNYVFTQAGANATALTVTNPATSPITTSAGTSTDAINIIIYSISIAPPPPIGTLVPVSDSSSGSSGPGAKAKQGNACR